jgi:glycosyltransferase involved in cell wall biosynthesis
MRIVVLNNMAPFVWGGAEELAMNLVRQLELRGHEAELIRLPLRADPPEVVPTQVLMAQRMVVEGADRVIALKFPAYLVPHANKVVWLLHQLRQAYDLFDAGMSNIAADELGDEVRRIVRSADREALSAVPVFVNSTVTRDRLQRYNGIDAEVLLPPLNNPELFPGGEDGGYVFAGGRVNGAKRQLLLVEAMARTRRGPQLVIAGPPDSNIDAKALRDRVDELALGDRIVLDLRLLDRDEYAAYVNGSSAVAYLPFDEDSLGYVTMEAAEAAKPVLTTSDSGGVLQLVRHGKTGWVSAPDPDALARALDTIGESSAARARLGGALRARWRGLDATWDHTIERLLA